MTTPALPPITRAQLLLGAALGLLGVGFYLGWQARAPQAVSPEVHAHEQAAQALDQEAAARRPLLEEARRETGDAVAHGVFRGQEEHGYVVARVTQPLQDGHAVEVGHHDVEDERVRVELARLRQGVEARSGGTHLPPLHPQCHRQEVGEHLLVVDDEHAKSGAVGAAQRRGGGSHASILVRFLWTAYATRYGKAMSSPGTCTARP